MTTPSVSVIVPNYNHAPYLTERIRSILDQSFTDFELIILDDASTDNSREIIESFRSEPRVAHIIFNEKNNGILTAQWKKGLDQARGKWVWIAESDDTAHPDFLSEFFTCLQSNPDLDLFFCDSKATRPLDGGFTFASERRNTVFATTKWNSSYITNGRAELNEALKYDCTINNLSAAVFRKSRLNEILDVALPYRYYADWYLYIQVAAKGKICYSNKAYNNYRVHPASLLGAKTSSVTSKTEYFRILQSLLDKPFITEKQDLLHHFCFNYLSVGLRSEGAVAIARILSGYCRLSPALALKVIWQIVMIKLFYRRYAALYSLDPANTDRKSCRHFVQS